MSKIYGQIIDNLTIDGRPAPYPVVNEREIRATAGLMFALGLTTFFTVYFTQNYLFLSIIVGLFWLEFALKTFFQPNFSLFGFLTRPMISQQKPEYVGAIQKRFAWTLGLLMATSMIFIAIIFQIRGPLPLLICGTCLTLMWMESALGICVGCNIYSFLLKKKILKQPEFQPACPGGACEIKRSN